MLIRHGGQIETNTNSHQSPSPALTANWETKCHFAGFVNQGFLGSKNIIMPYLRKNSFIKYKFSYFAL